MINNQNQQGMTKFSDGQNAEWMESFDSWLKVWPIPAAWDETARQKYQMAIQHLSPAMLNEAFRRCAKTSRFLPMPADLLEAVKDDLARQAASRSQVGETPYSAAAKAWVKAGYPGGLKPIRKQDGTEDDDIAELDRKRAECERIILERDTLPGRPTAADRVAVAEIMRTLRRMTGPLAPGARGP